MPVSIITSHGRPGAISFHRATCSALLSTGRAVEPSAASTSSGPTPCSTARLAPSGSWPKLVGFRPGRDEESRGTGLEQRVHRLARADAIAVGLDRRAAGGAGASPRASANCAGARRGRASGEAGGAWRAPLAGRACSPSRRALAFFPILVPSNCVDRRSSTGSSRQLRVDAPRIRVRARLVEALHPAWRAEQMLGRAGAEAIAGQRLAAALQREIARAGP